MFVIFFLFFLRLHGTCNHIAGLLFRVEYAVRTGLATSKTSELCKWKVPANNIGNASKPVKLEDLKWTKDTYFKQG